MGNRTKTSPIWITSKQDLEKIVQDNNTLSGILRDLNLEPSNSGGRFRSLKSRLEMDSIDYSHITLGNFANLGKKFPKKKLLLETVMIENSTYSRGTLKKRLIKEGILENKCDICGQLTEWKGQTLVMVLDHINGIRNDNRKENLRLLCPNCNSQQSTFAGKRNKQPSPVCKNCDNTISKCSKSGLCKSCYGKFYRPRKVKNRPSKAILLQKIEEIGYSATGRKYGVCFHTIKKWVK